MAAGVVALADTAAHSALRQIGLHGNTVGDAGATAFSVAITRTHRLANGTGVLLTGLAIGGTRCKSIWLTGYSFIS